MASKPEQRVWRGMLRPALAAVPGIEFERLELATGAAGIPDVVYTLGGTGFIENKYSDRATTIDLSGWKTRQRSWAKRHREAGGTVFLFVGTKKSGCFLLDPSTLYDEKNTTMVGRHVLNHWPDKPDAASLWWKLRIPNG